MMIALAPMELKNACDRLQSFESEVPNILLNDLDGERSDFADKNIQIIDSPNNTYGLLSDLTGKADNLDPIDRHESNGSTILDTYNPNDTALYPAQNQYFSQPQPQPLYGTDASGSRSSYETCTTASVPLITQTDEYIEARSSIFLQSQLEANWEYTSATVMDNAILGGITDKQMAELVGFADVGFNQNEGSSSFKNLL
jgi:hypothetical protein